MITSDIELLEVFYAHTISPICIAFATSLVCIIIQVQFGWIYGLYSLFAYVVVGVVLPVFISKQSRQIGVEYRKEAANLNSYVLESMRGLKESMQYMDTDSRLLGLNENFYFGYTRKGIEAFSGKDSFINKLLCCFIIFRFMFDSYIYE